MKIRKDEFFYISYHIRYRRIRPCVFWSRRIQWWLLKLLKRGLLVAYYEIFQNSIFGMFLNIQEDQRPLIKWLSDNGPWRRFGQNLTNQKENRNNPFSRGNFLSNCSQILCGPIPPSQIKATQPATKEQYDIYQRNCQMNNKKVLPVKSGSLPVTSGSFLDTSGFTSGGYNLKFRASTGIQQQIVKTILIWDRPMVTVTQLIDEMLRFVNSICSVASPSGHF